MRMSHENISIVMGLNFDYSGARQCQERKPGRTSSGMEE